ncbi:MAG: YMGG-like glycine zipper-containing protein [Planctomycetota bacterium]|nr:YMGG-like glycine zipper-containing protein [Planctomycetota bacterium]MEC9048464.1 YMGG-like glycine zipper-containing protein [Planctomycetota bacterium]
MTRSLLVACAIFVALLLGACSAAKPLPRQALAPAATAQPAQPAPERVRTEAAERQPLPRSQAVAERASNAARPHATLRRSVVEEAAAETAPPPRTTPSYDAYGDYRERRPAPRRRRETSFPVNTAVGAGFGAVLGHQAGRRDEGALIGGGIGLLFDLARWSR